MILFSIIVSPLHPQFSKLYKKMGLIEYGFTSERKAIQALKINKPDIVVADFIYGYGNNYAGVNVSNLDVFFYSLQKEAPEAKKIIFVEKSEKRFVEKLKAIFTLEEIFVYPVSRELMQKTLEQHVDLR